MYTMVLNRYNSMLMLFTFCAVSLVNSPRRQGGVSQNQRSLQLLPGWEGLHYVMRPQEHSSSPFFCNDESQNDESRIWKHQFISLRSMRLNSVALCQAFSEKKRFLVHWRFLLYNWIMKIEKNKTSFQNDIDISAFFLYWLLDSHMTTKGHGSSSYIWELLPFECA